LDASQKTILFPGLKPQFECDGCGQEGPASESYLGAAMLAVKKWGWVFRFSAPELNLFMEPHCPTCADALEDVS
jgi:hypothetical protein